MTQAKSRIRVAGVLLLLALSAACGSEKNETEKIPPEVLALPRIVAFEASPAALEAGGSATLSWVTEGAQTIAIADGAGKPVPVDGLEIARGSVAVTPDATTTYTLTASGAAGAPGPAYRTLKVTVIPGPGDAPVIEAFEASAAEVPVGGEVTLTWRTRSTTRLTLKDDAGVDVDVSGLPVGEGSVTVRPTRSPTRYFLTAAGGGRLSTREVSVDVLGLPRVHRFFVSPLQPVAAGTAVKLVWETSRADRVVIRDDRDAVVLDTTTQPGGFLEVNLERTTRYDLVATGEGGQAAASVLAQVGASIELFSATPRVARAGDPITLTWNVLDADAVTITGPGGFAYDVPAAEVAAGETTVDLPASGDYVLTARREGVVQTWAIYVEVTEDPRVRSLVASDAVITAAPDHPASVSLTYVQDGGVTCTVYRNGLAVPELTGFACPRNGSVDVGISGDAELRFVAVNHTGSHHELVTVDTVDPARIVAFTKNPARRLGPGGTVELAWEVTDAVAVRLERDGAPVGIPATQLAGTRSETVDFDTTFALVAENALGHLTTANLTVLAGAPVIATFVADPPVLAPGETVTFAWSCDGGDSLSLLDPGGLALATATDPAAIDAGSATAVAPATPGTHVHTLRVENDAGQTDVATVELVVSDGPLIRNLTASKAQISLGQSVGISWTVTNDLAGTAPTLALADSFGNVYDVTGLDPNAGTATITPPEEGRHVFTLTATTEGTRPSSREVVVEVTVAAKIVSFTADPEVAYTDGGTPTVRLSWQTQNGVQLAIYEAAADGSAVPGALHRLSLADGDAQADIDASFFEHEPTVTTRYLLRVTNRIGNPVERLLTVLVDPPRIVSFEPDPAEIIQGEATSLTWTTANATVAMLQPMEPVITQVAGSFVDVSALPGAEQLPLTVNDSYQLVNFPADFRFPFDGQVHASMRVAMNGFISFDVASTTASGTNQASFPTSGTYRYVHLAPFWDVLQSYTTGSLWWHYDDVARTVTVMWKNWSYRSTSAPFDMNFEVVLHENGSFEYHYGTMWGGLTSTPTDYQYYADGAYATVGFQDLAGTTGKLIHYGNSSTTGRFPGGFGNKGWVFDLATPVSGSRAVTPSTSRTYTLVAANADLSVSKTTDVKVWAQPSINVASIYPSGPQANTPFLVSWRNSNVTRVRVRDGQGNLLCEETGRVEVLQGSCELTLPTPGNQSVTVEAINGLERNLATRTLNFMVFPRLAVESFTVTKTFITAGEQVTVSWEGEGGFAAQLYACQPKTNHGVCTPVDIGAQDPNLGSYTTTLSESKEFWFRLVDRLARSQEATANVWVDAPTLDGFTASATQVPAGGSVTLNWQSTGSPAASITGVPVAAPTEITGASAPFIDISSAGTTVPVVGTSAAGTFTFNFPQGFKFPYFGVDRTAIVAHVDGWASFDLTATSSRATNYELPYASYPEVHLAPFWDNLTMKAGGKFAYQLRTGTDGVRFLVLSWIGFEFSTSSYNPADLNFQVLLYETGFVEVRYGTMVSTASTTANRDYANAKSATLALQNDDATFGQAVFHNTTQNPGLTGRAWRFNLAFDPDGQATVTPTESTTYRICVTNGSKYDACREIRVVVVKPGHLLISELMVAPAVADGEWFEVRNISVDPIDLAGFVIASGLSETVSVPASPPVVIAPNSFAVLARSADPAVNGGVEPTFVYGAAIDLGDTADDVALKLGSLLVDKVAWAADWPIQADRSITLEPSVYEPVEAANNSVVNWCPTSTVYGAGLSGNPGAMGQGCKTTGGFAHYVLDPYAGKPFVNIAATGTEVTGLFATPYFTGPIPIGFDFPYFGDVATEFYVTKFGYVALAPILGTPSTANSEIPSATTEPNGIVAPMWDTHYDKGEASIHYELRVLEGHLVLIVQWTNVSPATSSSDYGLTTFQTQLWDDGDIVFAYSGLVKPKSSSYVNYQYIYGSGSTIGLESIAGDQAIQVFYGSSSSAGAPAYDGRSYRFIRR